MPGNPRRLIGYIRAFSRDDQGSLSRQRQLIEAACERSKWQLVDLVSDASADPPGLNRPRLGDIIARLGTGDGDGMIVAVAQVIASRVPELVDLIAWLDQSAAALVILEPVLDTATKSGRSAADVITALVGAERDRDRLLHARRQAVGKGRGRLAVAGDPELRRRIVSMRESGMSLQAIADTLNAEEVATVRDGALWRPSSVQAATGYRRPRAKPPPPPPATPPRSQKPHRPPRSDRPKP